MILYTLQKLSKVHQCKICCKPSTPITVTHHPVYFGKALQSTPMCCKIPYSIPALQIPSLQKLKVRHEDLAHQSLPVNIMKHCHTCDTHQHMLTCDTLRPMLTFPRRRAPTMSLVQILHPTIAILATHCVLLSVYGLPALLFLFKIDPHLRE